MLDWVLRNSLSLVKIKIDKLIDVRFTVQLLRQKYFSLPKFCIIYY